MSGDSYAHLAVLTLDLHIPASQSLKTKRMALKSLKDRVRGKFNVSIAEIGEQDKWQRSEIAVCMVGNDKQYVEGALQSVLDYVREERAVSLIDSSIEFV